MVLISAIPLFAKRIAFAFPPQNFLFSWHFRVHLLLKNCMGVRLSLHHTLKANHPPSFPTDRLFLRCETDFFRAQAPRLCLARHLHLSEVNVLRPALVIAILPRQFTFAATDLLPSLNFTACCLHTFEEIRFLDLRFTTISFHLLLYMSFYYLTLRFSLASS